MHLRRTFWVEKEGVKRELTCGNGESVYSWSVIERASLLVWGRGMGGCGRVKKGQR